MCTSCTAPPSHLAERIFESPPELFVLFPLDDLQDLFLCLIVLPVPGSLQSPVEVLPSVSLSVLEKVMSLVLALF